MALHAPVGGSFNALSQDQDTDQLRTDAPKTGVKRHSPDSGLTPPLIDSRRKLNNSSDTDFSMEVGQPITVPPRGEVCDGNTTPSEVSGYYAKKWSFKLSTECFQGFDSPRHVVQFFTEKGTNVKFTNVKITQSRKIILLRTEFEHEPRIFNSLLKHLPEASEHFSMKLSVDYFKQRTERLDPTTRHVILRNVPNFLTEEDICDEVVALYGDENVERVTRVKSRMTGKPTNMIRIICADEQTAKKVLTNGLLICGVSLHGEKAFSSPNITRCYRCQAPGHMQHACKNPQKCGRCGEDHRTRECTVDNPNEWRCSNCNGAHATWYHACPVIVQHVEELRQSEAREEEQGPPIPPIVKAQNTNNRATYAQALRTPHSSTSDHQGNEVEKLLREFSQTIEKMEQQFTEKIADLSTEIDTLKEENSKLKEELQTIATIDQQTKRSEVMLLRLNDKTSNLNDKLKNISVINEEHYKSLSHDIQCITAHMCKTMSERNLKCVHEHRTRGTDFEANVRAVCRHSSERLANSTLKTTLPDGKPKKK